MGILIVLTIFLTLHSGIADVPKNELRRSIEMRKHPLKGIFIGAKRLKPAGVPASIGVWGFYDPVRCVEEERRMEERLRFIGFVDPHVFHSVELMPELTLDGRPQVAVEFLVIVPPVWN